MRRKLEQSQLILQCVLKPTMPLEVLKSVGKPVTWHFKVLYLLGCTSMSFSVKQTEVCKCLCLQNLLGMLLSIQTEEAVKQQAKHFMVYPANRTKCCRLTSVSAASVPQALLFWLSSCLEIEVRGRWEQMFNNNNNNNEINPVTKGLIFQKQTPFLP